MVSCLSLRVQISSFDKLQTMTYGYLKSALGPVVVVPLRAQCQTLVDICHFLKADIDLAI